MNYRARFTVVLSSTAMVALLLFGSVVSKGASGEGGSDTADVLRHLKVYTQVLSYISTEYVEEPNIPNVTLRSAGTACWNRSIRMPAISMRPSTRNT